ncbi:serine/threonine-protein kinase [Mycobacterium sp.]|uniref:serine/threonine-protein kinase n=1 Tax=Mycobacterium sp. TaxID=1785 RepID=UPI002BF7A041|nr:serine/threonine-protein kinase [Mycobacterium sp.]HXB88647.1 serine/threonine-protein kinase [Mycobacterium sp.]
MPVSVGELFAGFTILRVLGAGAMGTVYLAAHPRLPRQDALKVLSAELTADSQYQERFLREAELAATLSHPNILGIHDRGEYEGQFWISMDYVAGTDAGRLVRDHHSGGMPLDDALAIIIAVGSALDYAHERGLLHRDVKPANILLDSQTRRIFLADFGIARRIDDISGLTATNMAVGTVSYAAPEQLKGEPLDGRADQYALACTAFHLLTGSLPYADSNPAVVITKHCMAPPPSLEERRPELVGLDPVLARAMAKAPAERFASCRDFTTELQRLLKPSSAHFHTPRPAPAPPEQSPTQPSQVVPASVFGTAAQRVSRSRLVLAALVVIPLLIVAGGVFAGVTYLQHRGQAGSTNPADEASSATAAAKAHSFNGTYRADYGPGTDLEGKPVAGATAMTGTWGVRSTCGASGCVATASYTGGSGIVLVSNLVFDEVGSSWIAVGLGSTPCNNAPAEVWVVFTLQPQPDGTLSGETTRSTTNSCSSGKRRVTFTRTGDPDVTKIPDPAALPPRAASPASALHGRYHETITYANGNSAPGQDDVTVRTECLRAGDRCMSLFHAPDGVVPLVFSGGKWTRDDEGTVPCNLGGTVHIRLTAEYPLPDPLQEPIPVLTGHGQNVTAGSACAGGDFEDKFERTGD